MAADLPDSLDAFEPWLLHRVAQAVEAGEVSAQLLEDLRAEFEAARQKSREERRALPSHVGVKPPFVYEFPVDGKDLFQAVPLLVVGFSSHRWKVGIRISGTATCSVHP